MHLGLQGWVISSILVGCMWFRLALKEPTESDAATVWRMGYICMQDGSLVTLLPSGNGVRTYVVSCRLWEDMLVTPSRWTQTSFWTTYLMFQCSTLNALRRVQD